jgi:hypothetical protein
MPAPGCSLLNNPATSSEEEQPREQGAGGDGEDGDDPVRHGLNPSGFAACWECRLGLGRGHLGDRADRTASQRDLRRSRSFRDWADRLDKSWLFGRSCPHQKSGTVGRLQCGGPPA